MAECVFQEESIELALLGRLYYHQIRLREQETEMLECDKHDKHDINVWGNPETDEMWGTGWLLP